MSTDFNDTVARIEAGLANVPPSALQAIAQALQENPALATAVAQEIERTYQGEGLDTQLAEFGQRRLSGESDWDFRKRTFPAVFARDENAALRIIFTTPHFFLTQAHTLLLSSLAEDTSPAGLRMWANGFGHDPYHTYHGL